MGAISNPARPSPRTTMAPFAPFEVILGKASLKVLPILLAPKAGLSQLSSPSAFTLWIRLSFIMIADLAGHYLPFDMS
jgi:hypothetical protein